MNGSNLAKHQKVFAWRDMNWHDKGACLGMDVEMFYVPDGLRDPKRREFQNRAIAVCNTCPVKMKCLEEAIAWQDNYAIMGGTTPEMRKELCKRL